MTALGHLRALGAGEEPPEGAKERVYAALLASAQVAAAAGAAAAAATAAAKVDQLASQAGRDAAGGALLGQLGSGKLAALGVGALLLGGVAGASIYGSLLAPEVKVVYVDRPVPVLVPPATPSSVPAPAPVSTVGKQTASAISKPAPALETEASELAQERALLDQARRSAAQGDAPAALEVAERHRTRFPSGRLAEEREALAIRALVASGRSEEARRRAQAFRASYPNSLFGGVVDPAATEP
jgi:hypothetical protein